eukprot:CAMPEP_0203774544 /NCGR_PEP_ID=MMETSP0099_2-20121227/5418_1 /ASSEMBLY_ACC=CAM_ASM_000209 /TAXON_ID=96639 /ORGANISM=" , Strain NY0313808BC1" /LENGTH=442 /DNA_ID=CAMNT_0050672789 /DNA_START=191 /DNA_END=1519 /DNA_ORIENTATION=+
MANCCMSAASGADGISARAAKMFYILLLGLSTVFALVLRYNGDKMDINLGPWNVHCSDRNETITNSYSYTDMVGVGGSYYAYCKGDAAVFRISFVLAVFFAIMAFMTISGSRFHRGFWGIKLTGLFCGLVACFFIPNSFFDNSGYAWIARIVSMIFLCLQILILIDFAYQWNDSWVEHAFPQDGSEDHYWMAAILGCAGVLYLVPLIGIPLLFTFYGECAIGISFSTLVLIGIIVFTVLTLFRDRLVGIEGAILPAAIVAAYCTYLCWSSLDSNPELECKPSGVGAGNNTVNVTVGIIIATISLMWTSLSVTDSLQSLVSGQDVEAGGESGPNATTPLYTVEGEDGQERQAQRPALETSDESSDWNENHVWVFHLTMMTAAMYMSMLLTNWGAEDNAHGNENGKVGYASMWVKFVSAFLTMILYIWTLVAPKVLGEYRDFDF